LHATGATDGRVGDISITADFVGGIYDDDSFLLCQDPGCFSQHRRLAYPGPTQEEYALAIFDDVLDDGNGTVDSAAYPAGEADDVSLPVAYGCDAVEGAGNASPVVGVELSYSADDVLDFVLGDLRVS
jgi:hypothetical protein